jgi:hypothetical protein
MTPVRHGEEPEPKRVQNLVSLLNIVRTTAMSLGGRSWLEILSALMSSLADNNTVSQVDITGTPDVSQKLAASFNNLINCINTLTI